MRRKSIAGFRHQTSAATDDVEPHGQTLRETRISALTRWHENQLASSPTDLQICHLLAQYSGERVRMTPSAQTLLHFWHEIWMSLNQNQQPLGAPFLVGASAQLHLLYEQMAWEGLISARGASLVQHATNTMIDSWIEFLIKQAGPSEPLTVTVSTSQHSLSKAPQQKH